MRTRRPASPAFLFVLLGAVLLAGFAPALAASPKPSRTSNLASSKDLFLEARARERAGEDSAALALYRQAYRRDPGNRDLCFMVLERLKYASTVDSNYAFAQKCDALPGKPSLSEAKALGEQALRAEDAAGALKYYQRAHDLDEDDADVLYVLAGLYEDARAWDKYVPVAEALLPRLDYPAPLMERLLRAYSILDRPEAALALLQNAWLKTSRLPYGQALAHYYDGRGLSLSLLETARLLSQVQPGPEQDWLLARAYAAADRPDSALIVTDRLLKSLSAPATKDDSLSAVPDLEVEGVRYFRANLLYDRGRYAEAYRAAQELAKARPDAASVLFLQGSAALELRRSDAATLLEKALAQVPLAPEYRARVAYARYVAAGKKRSGVDVSSVLAYPVSDSLKADQAALLEGFAQGQLARTLDPRDPWERPAVLTDTALARRHRVLAVTLFEKVLASGPANDSMAVTGSPASQDSLRARISAAAATAGRRAARFELATHLEKLGRRDEAKGLLRRLIAQDSTQTMALNYLGYMLVENLPVDSAALREAGDLLDRAVAIEPENGAYLDSKGWWFYRQGNLDSSRVYLERAERSMPSDPSILDHLAEVLKAQGKVQEACAVQARIRTRDPRRKLSPECAR